MALIDVGHHCLFPSIMQLGMPPVVENTSTCYLHVLCTTSSFKYTCLEQWLQSYLLMYFDPEHEPSVAFPRLGAHIEVRNPILSTFKTAICHEKVGLNI